MRVTPVAGMTRSFDKDRRGDSERRRLEYFLKLVQGMDIPGHRIERVRTSHTRWHALRWFDKNMALRNADHKDFERARNVLNLLLKSEGVHRDR